MLKSKTFWAGVAAIITALAGYLTEEMTAAQAAQTALGGAVAIFLRQGIAKGPGGLACIALLVLCLGAAGCATTSVKDLPDQEESTVEKAAVSAHKKFAEELVKNLDKLSSTTYVEPINPEQPVQLVNGRLVAKTVDSRMFDMLASVGNFSGHKSAPGFWSTLNNIVGRVWDTAERLAPWYFSFKMAETWGETANRIASNQRAPVNTNYNLTGDRSNFAFQIDQQAGSAGAGAGINQNLAAPWARDSHDALAAAE